MKHIKLYNREIVGSASIDSIENLSDSDIVLFDAAEYKNEFKALKKRGQNAFGIKDAHSVKHIKSVCAVVAKEVVKTANKNELCQVSGDLIKECQCISCCKKSNDVDAELFLHNYLRA